MNRKPIKPCTEGARHKWTFSHATTDVTRFTGGRARIARKNVYRCACGAIKKEGA